MSSNQLIMMALHVQSSDDIMGTLLNPELRTCQESYLQEIEATACIYIC